MLLTLVAVVTTVEIVIAIRSMIRRIRRKAAMTVPTERIQDAVSRETVEARRLVVATVIRDLVVMVADAEALLASTEEASVDAIHHVHHPETRHGDRVRTPQAEDDPLPEVAEGVRSPLLHHLQREVGLHRERRVSPRDEAVDPDLRNIHGTLRSQTPVDLLERPSRAREVGTKPPLLATPRRKRRTTRRAARTSTKSPI